MAEFINTIDLLGDEVVAKSIIDRSITEFNDDALSSVGDNAFRDCTSLKSVNLLSATSIGWYAFSGCSSLEIADFSSITSLMAYAFLKCTKLNTLILRTTTVCTLGNTNALNNTLIASGTGYIYVPASLVDSYKAASNWSKYANQFRALEDYTVDGTTTGELDPTKI